MAKPNKPTQAKKENEKKSSSKVDKNAKVAKTTSKKNPVKKNEIVKPEKAPSKTKTGTSKVPQKENLKPKVIGPGKVKKAAISIGKLPSKKEIKESNKKLLAATKLIDETTNKSRTRVGV
jgi:hypothetical protein